VDFADLPLPIVMRINALADDFEAAWQAGERPHIEDFLAETDGLGRTALVQQLVPLDADYRRWCEESPLPEEYLPRFPELDHTWLARTLGDDSYRPFGLARRTHDSDTPIQNDTLTSAGDAAEIPGERFGDYDLLAEAGRGGMGVVFRARQRQLNRIVALKMIVAGRLADDAHIRRFYAEARAAARLHHPGIVPVYEVGEHDGQHFLSMAFVEGSDLGALVSRGALPVVQAAKLIKEAAEAVQYTHERGIIHRDLKPQNILVDGTGRPQITDFGLAKDVRADGMTTATGTVLGTPSYMAPEQAEGATAEIGPAADVYSLGATLYHLLTGQPAFHSTKPIETLQHLLDREPTLPRCLNPAIPKDLETICLTCLRKDPQRRYHSASALAEDLHRWLNREPICARPVTRRRKFWLWCRRRPATVLLLVLLMAAIVGPALISHMRVTQTIDPAPQELALVQWAEAHELGKQGKWDEVARLMQKAIPLLSRDLRKWQELKNVQLFLGEFDQAHAICDEMLRRFGDTADPKTAHVLAGACLALPDREVGPEVQRLAELSAKVRNPTHYRDIGILNYRQGNLADAVQWLNEALGSGELYRPATFYYLAMVRHKRGNEVGAQEAFHEADRYRELLSSQIAAGGLDHMRYSLLSIEAVRREAASLLSSD
jgi:tetratricopeptide (TPR) repeat protein/predicted Ser/Thr protein kinase